MKHLSSKSTPFRKGTPLCVLVGLCAIDRALRAPHPHPERFHLFFEALFAYVRVFDHFRFPPRLVSRRDFPALFVYARHQHDAVVGFRRRRRLHENETTEETSRGRLYFSPRKKSGASSRRRVVVYVVAESRVVSHSKKEEESRHGNNLERDFQKVRKRKACLRC